MLVLIEAPPKPIGEKRITFRNLDWFTFKQIQRLLSDRTRARFTTDFAVDPKHGA